jgi:minor extracellular serine protease Vpr
MRFHSFRALSACAIIISVSSNAGAVRPEPVAVPDGGLIKPVWTPLGVSKAPVTVVIQLSGEPVALHQERAGRKLDRADKERIKGALKSQQDALRGSIEAMGGRVLAQFQSSYNGIKVRVGRDRVAALASLPGVVAVRPLQVFKPNATAAISPDNVRGVPMIGAPSVWGGAPGFRGEGIKIGIIDTGIDYTHANFGGPGTAAAYRLAHDSGAEKLAANPLHFGPAAARVKGGIDLVGDDYDASADPDEDGNPSPKLIPHPDPNPLDCNGHGSHVAGSAGGSGVTAAGATYTGPYNASTIDSQAWTIAPGVAPKADLYAIRVFGCLGSTDVTVEAIEWAVDNDMDVINMSLGSPFGSKDDPSAVASTNAARAGVIVVTSAGNSGANQYITGSPGTAQGAIATAANDPWATTPAARIVLSNGVSMTGINANGHSLANLPDPFKVKVIVDNPDTPENEALGCSVEAFGGPLPPNTIAVVNRDVCARVAKAIFGEKAGAAAVVMVNNAAGLPPFEGPITSNPDTGERFTVTIPFIGVSGPPAPTPPATSDGQRLRAANGLDARVTSVDIVNANFTGFASFTSGGPRTGDGSLKPDVTAPGVSIASTGMGSGNQAAVASGTSMASPHVAGVAAPTRQAHPSWKVEDIKAAIVNTAQPSVIGGLAPHRISRGGTGLVQPARSTATQVLAGPKGDKLNVSLSFGVEELKGNFSRTNDLVLRNNGPSAVTFSVAQVAQARQANLAFEPQPHSVSFSPASVTVPANGTATVAVTLTVPAATAGTSDGAVLSFREVAGFVQFTPNASQNGDIALRVPYHLVTRPQADVSTTIGALSRASPSTTATVTNRKGVVTGDADFYAWGLAADDTDEQSAADIRAVGVQAFPFSATQQLLIFAVNSHHRWSNAATNEFDILVDVDNDGVDDYVVVGVDQGAVQTGTFNGRMAAFVFSTRSPNATVNFFATAPTDSSSALLPVLSSQLCRLNGPGPEDDEPCLSEANPRLTYQAVGFDLLEGGAKAVPGPARFNAWSSSISQGGFVSNLAPGGTGSVPISVNLEEWARTPAMGIMVVTLDNKSGENEAQLISVELP